MSRKSRLILAFALVITLCAGVFAPIALAEPPEPTEPKEPTIDTTLIRTAAITKLLQMPVGTEVPKANFIFDVIPVSFNESAESKGRLPTIGEDNTETEIPNDGIVTISFPKDPYTHTELDKDGNDRYFLESVELFNNDNIKWPTTGIYTYRISERTGTYQLRNHEQMIYSEAAYEIRVHVAQDPDTKALYIHAIGATRVKGDGGGSSDDKVDPTPGEDSSVNNYSQMLFTNTYMKQTGGLNPDPDTDPDNPDINPDPEDPKPLDSEALIVSKKVAGDFSNTNDYFKYEMTVTKPNLVSDGPLESTFYRAYIIEDGTVQNDLSKNEIEGATVRNDAKGNASILFQSGKKVNFSLKANQELVFVWIHVGSSYVIEEKGTLGYVPSVTVTQNNKTELYNTSVGKKDEGIEIPNVDIKANYLRVAEKRNEAAFLNTADGTPDTGINVNDLPFYGLILLALGGIVALIVVKIRRNKNYDA